MTSKLNNGSIIAIQLQSDEVYTIGYLLKNDKTISGHLQTFIKMLTDFFKQTYKINWQTDILTNIQPNGSISYNLLKKHLQKA